MIIFMKVLHWYLSCARSIKYTARHLPFKPTLILPNMTTVPQSFTFISRFLTKILFSPLVQFVPPYFSLHNLITLIRFGKKYKLWNPQIQCTVFLIHFLLSLRSNCSPQLSVPRHPQYFRLLNIHSQITKTAL